MCRTRMPGQYFLLITLSAHLVVAGSVAASEPGNSKAWLPKPAADSAPVKPARVRIVDFGHDFLRDGDGRPRHQFAVHRYRLVKDPSTGLNVPNDDVLKQDADAEVDGDSRTNDVVGYMEYSMDCPFSPVTPWYDRLAGTPRWYGAASLFQANSHEAKLTENGVNHEHDGPNHYPRDNWALFHDLQVVCLRSRRPRPASSATERKHRYGKG